MYQTKAVGCRELLKDYEGRKHDYAAYRLVFEGAEGYDVYNISQEFEEGGQFYLAGRVEKRDNEIPVSAFSAGQGNTGILQISLRWCLRDFRIPL